MDLMQKLPSEAYNGERHVKVFQDAINAQVADVQAARDDFKLQCSPTTATWGLSKYEQEVGIPVDESKPIEQRRSAYIAKRRGVGTTTATVLKNIAKSFCTGGGDVEVIEHKREFWLEFIFTNTPILNTTDLKAILEELKPAHMEVALLRKMNTMAAINAVVRPKIGRIIRVQPYRPETVQATVTINTSLHTKGARRIHVHPKGD